MKKRLVFNVWLNRILIASFFSIISISTYTIYMKYFYVATQPFEIYVEEEEIEQILKDYEDELGKYVDKPDEREYYHKNEIIVQKYKGKRFAIKYLLDGNMKYSLSMKMTVYTSRCLKNYYYDMGKFLIFYSINPNQKYEGVRNLDSEQILRLIEEGKWIGKYE